MPKYQSVDAELVAANFGIGTCAIFNMAGGTSLKFCTSKSQIILLILLTDFSIREFKAMPGACHLSSDSTFAILYLYFSDSWTWNLRSGLTSFAI
ncbi:hypothetical protein SDJN03_29122, partial [Cucurbita argyrosperma subsp. sororia]